MHTLLLSGNGIFYSFGFLAFHTNKSGLTQSKGAGHDAEQPKSLLHGVPKLSRDCQQSLGSHRTTGNETLILLHD